jgi:hypothetical protein
MTGVGTSYSFANVVIRIAGYSFANVVIRIALSMSADMKAWNNIVMNHWMLQRMMTIGSLMDIV